MLIGKTEDLDEEAAMAGAWTEEDQKTLIAMIEAGASAQRIAVRMKRPLDTLKNAPESRVSHLHPSVILGRRG